MTVQPLQVTQCKPSVLHRRAAATVYRADTDLSAFGILLSLATAFPASGASTFLLLAAVWRSRVAADFTFADDGRHLGIDGLEILGQPLVEFADLLGHRRRQIVAFTDVAGEVEVNNVGAGEAESKGHGVLGAVAADREGDSVVGERKRSAVSLSVAGIRSLRSTRRYSSPGETLALSARSGAPSPSRSALVMALNEYEGAVLIISHDRHLIDATVDQIWIAEDGTIKIYDGDMASYQRLLLSAAKNSSGQANQGAGSPVDKKRERQEAAARRAELSPLRKKIQQAEKRIAQIQNELAGLELKFADETLYTDRPEEAVELGKQRGTLNSELEKLEAEWIENSDLLEQAQAAQ